LAVQVLYAMEAIPQSPQSAMESVLQLLPVAEKIRSFARQLVEGVEAHQEEIDRLLKNISENWRIERMSLTDRSILRLGIYELLYLKDIPPKVTLNEAVELGKNFGTDASGSFINGILDRIHQQSFPISGNTTNGE
jgi:N utilization substance protein B